MKKEMEICRKNRNMLIKIIFTFLYLVFIGLLYVFKVQCIYLRLFHVECPGCGMTRAWISAVTGDFGKAFSMHPLFWSIPIIYIFFLTDGHVFKSKWMNYVTLSLFAGGFITLFVFRLLKL